MYFDLLEHSSEWIRALEHDLKCEEETCEQSLSDSVHQRKFLGYGNNEIVEFRYLNRISAPHDPNFVNDVEYWW